DNDDLIHRYTRAQAIADGALIDVSSTAREAGIHYPVALTAAVWQKCVAVPPGVLCQDEAGRLSEANREGRRIHEREPMGFARSCLGRTLRRPCLGRASRTPGGTPAQPDLYSHR